MINKLINWLFAKRIERAAYDRFVALRGKQEQQDMERKIQYARMRIGEPIISISNTWKSPVIGIIVDIEQFGRTDQEPMFVVHDYVKNEEVLTFSTIYDFTHTRLNAFLALKPNERWAMACKHGDTRIRVAKGADLDREEALERLRQHGFWHVYSKYLEKQKEIRDADK